MACVRECARVWGGWGGVHVFVAAGGKDGEERTNEQACAVGESFLFTMPRHGGRLCVPGIGALHRRALILYSEFHKESM